MTAENGNVNCDDPGRSWPQVVAILAVSLGPFTNGIQFVWSSPFSLVIVQDKDQYNMTEEDTALFMLYQPLGMIVASLLFFKVSELLGRKKSLMCLAVPHFLSWVIIIFATNKWTFYASRFVAGIGDGILFATVPPYVGEIATPVVRGYCGNLPTFVLYVGQLFITVIGSYCSVRLTAYICIGIPVLYFVLVSFLPESPYQLVKDGQFDSAKRSIRWLRRKHDVEKEFLKIKADVERQVSESGTWSDLIKIKSNRRALRAGVFLRMSQQFCGVSTFATYTQPIFEKAGGNLSPQYSSIIFMTVISVLNFCSSLTVEKFGRKASYFYSLLSSGFLLIVMAVYFFLDQYELADLRHVNWFPLAAMILYVFAFSFGLGVVPTLMLGELFSASIKSKGLAVLIVIFGVFVLVTTNLFHLLTSYVGLFAPFLLYGISTLLSTVLTLKWVPETKGKTLEEIQQCLKN